MTRFFYSKLAVTNIKNHSKTYVPYIIACTVTIMMYYIMGMLYRDDGLMTMPSAVSLAMILKFGSYVVAILAVIFLFYINSFLIKRRIKEFGLFNVLGMEKRHIARVTFYETLYVAIISLGLGLVFGIVFSKLIQLFLINLLNFDVQMGINISIPSIFSTAILFCIIFLLTLINNLWHIHLSNPAELLKGGQVGEREPKTKWLMTIVGIIAIGVAYYMALTIASPLDALYPFFLAVVLVILGTYCLFTAGSIALLKLMRNNKKYYYKTKHFISVSGMIYRMKQNATGLASICILSTAVIIMISTTLSLYLGLEDTLRYRYPQNIYTEISDASDEDISSLDAAIDELTASYGASQLDTLKYRKLYFLTQGENGDFSTIEGYYSTSTKVIYMIPLEDYNRIENQSETLNSGEVLCATTDTSFAENTITVGETSFTVKSHIPFDRVLDDSLGMDSYCIVFPDTESILNAYNYVMEVNTQHLSYYYGFDTDADSDTQISLTYALDDIVKNYDPSAYVSGAEASRDSFLANYGGLLFLGIFLGIMFIMCTVLIIYYKQISEGYDDRERFQIMQKVGLSRSEVRKTIQSQVLSVFFLPIVIAGIHVAASFKIVTKLLALLNLTNVTLFALCALGTIIVFTLLYAVVYSLTSRTYYKIVR